MFENDKCYEVTYMVKCRICDTNHRDNAEELAKIFKATFNKGYLQDFTAGGSIETFKGTIVSMKEIKLKHPYKMKGDE